MATLKSRLQALEDAAPVLGSELTPLHHFYGEDDPPGYVPVYWTGERRKHTLADFYAGIAAQEPHHATT